MTDDDLEQRLRSHFHATDPGRAPQGLAVRIGLALERRPRRPAFFVRTRPAFAIALAAVVIAALGLGLGLRPVGFLTSATTTPPPTAMEPSKASPGPSPTPAPALTSASVDLCGTFGGGGLWAVRDSTLFVSTDAGANWQRGASPIAEGSVGAAFVLDPAHAWAVTSALIDTIGAPADVPHLVMSRTTDGGQTWQRSTIPGNYAYTTLSLAFADATHGYLIASAQRLSSAPGTILRTADGGATWSVAGTYDSLGSMFSASDASTVWAGAEPEAGPNTHPILDVSRDGGRTWQDARLPGLEGQVGGAVRWLPGPPVFLDAANGFVAVVSADGNGRQSETRIYGTTDAGRSWALVTDLPVEASAGPAVPYTTRWLLPVDNPFGLLTTADGGASWQEVTTTGLSNGGWIVWIGAVDPSHVAALVPSGNSYPGVASLYLSADGGRTWRPADLTAAAAPQGSPGPTPAPVPAVSSVAFFDAARGLVVGATTTGDGAVWRTSDGGRTWAETDLGMPALAFVTVSGPSSAWATVLCPNPAWTGDTCSVIESSDGGVTWHPVSDRKLVGLSFVDAEHGWAVVPEGPAPGGVVGGLLSTADGGRTWTALASSPCLEIGWPVSVSFVDRLHGWVGCGGMAGAGEAPKGVAETTDGGRTWTVRARVAPPSSPVGSISISDYLEGIAMRPSGVGLAWEGRGGTLRTTDGGRTWTPMPPGGSDAGPIPAGGWAITDRDWLILLWDPNAQATVLYGTHDGGSTWRALSRVPGAP